MTGQEKNAATGTIRTGMIGREMTLDGVQLTGMQTGIGIEKGDLSYDPVTKLYDVKNSK